MLSHARDQRAVLLEPVVTHQSILYQTQVFSFPIVTESSEAAQTVVFCAQVVFAPRA